MTAWWYSGITVDTFIASYRFDHFRRVGDRSSTAWRYRRTVVELTQLVAPQNSPGVSVKQQGSLHDRHFVKNHVVPAWTKPSS